MKEISLGYFYSKLQNKKEHYPLGGKIQLTYRCNLDCVHCYCKGSEDKERELNTLEWKKILDEIQKEGCLYLTLSGGEPLIREDFLELYSYAKKKCFIITIFTNGQILEAKILDYLTQYPPYSIEITLNGITQRTYEAITRVKGSFLRVMENIRKIKERKLPLILKSNCLKENKNEIAKIKAFVDAFLGRKNGKSYFKYDPKIYPRLNGDKAPTNFRLSFREILELRKQDSDIWKEYRKNLKADFPTLRRDKGFVYHCNTWKNNFIIDPYGTLKFCVFLDKFSVDLKNTSFREGFYQIFPQLLNEKFKTNSKCKDCHLRPICHNCPAKAYLETGDEEAPVPYYCSLAKGTAKLMGQRQEKNGNQILQRFSAKDA